MSSLLILSTLLKIRSLMEIGCPEAINPAFLRRPCNLQEHHPPYASDLTTPVIRVSQLTKPRIWWRFRTWAERSMLTRPGLLILVFTGPFWRHIQANSPILRHPFKADTKANASLLIDQGLYQRLRTEQGVKHAQRTRPSPSGLPVSLLDKAMAFVVMSACQLRE